MKTILLVEDERDLAEGLEMVCDNEGYIMYRLQGAKDALEFCLTIKPNIIISNLKLGWMDGLSLLKLVRGIGRLHHVPFVIVSMARDASFVGKAQQFGATAYFTKPFDVEELVDVVRNTLSPYKKHETSV